MIDYLVWQVCVCVCTRVHAGVGVVVEGGGVAGGGGTLNRSNALVRKKSRQNRSGNHGNSVLLISPGPDRE